MARGILFPAGLTVLIVVLALVHQTCSAEDSDHLCPSSCGNIRNIRYPFRLEGDSENCGDQRYNLSCENNQTVLYLYAGKYYVREINYTNYKIRVVDPGILNDNDSFIARYPLDFSNFSSEDPYQLSNRNSPGAMVFLNCEKPVNSPWYFDITCLKNGVYSSNSSLSRLKKYTYFLLSGETGDVEDLCQVAQISVSPWRASNSPINMSCAAVRNELVLGFELLWYRAYCESKCGSRHGSCDLDEAANIFSCYRHGGVARIFYILESTYYSIMNILAGPMNIIYEKLYDQLYYDGRDSEEFLFDKGELRHVLVFDKALINNFLKFMTIDYGLFQAVKMILGTPFVIAFLIYKWRMRHLSMYDVIEEFLQSHNNLTPIRYSYSEVKKMTKSFKEKLGEGGYGTVYKGTLRSGRLVAIKMLNTSKTNGQDFISEVATIGRIHHVNVVQLIGFCVEGSKRALVYEFMPNGSLNKYIFLSEVSTLLSFDRMYDIALGVARGIEYLHQGCDMQILHFDIKPHNILLDENFTPKVSDFGLAKLYPVNNSIVSLTAARGTLGYMAPELFYKNIGSVSYKADVYSFGMLLLEMAGRRKNLNAFAEHSSQIYFPTWVYDQLNDGNNIEMEDATEEERKIGKKMIIVALWCIQMKPSDRLPMNKVIHMLEGEVECLQMPSKPFLSSLDRVIIGSGENSNQSNESSQSSQF